MSRGDFIHLMSYDQIQDAFDGLQEFKSYNGSICAVMNS